jgi:cysteine-rich repeat protein
MRPDRDDYVIIHCDAVWDSSDGTPADCSQSCTGYGCNFRKYDPTDANWSTPYDSLSLMHYAPYEFGKGPGPAIEARPGVSTPTEHTFPTIKDAQKVCELYSDKCTNVCGDGVVSGEEQCDDGNNFDGDGCNAGCKREGEDVCGDGIITAANWRSMTATARHRQTLAAYLPATRGLLQAVISRLPARRLGVQLRVVWASICVRAGMGIGLLGTRRMMKVCR